jgi:flagellar protein FlaG
MTIDTIGALGSARPAERSFASETMAAGARATAPATAVATANAVKGTPSLDQLNRAVSELNQSQQAKSQGLEFSIDSDTQRTVVKVIDQSTKEVLRQIPTPEALEIAKALEAKSTRGVLIQQTA